MIIAIDAHCSCAPTLTGKMEQNLHINGYTRHFSPYFSVDLSVEFFEEQSRITQQVGMIVLAGHVLKNCTRYLIISSEWATPTFAGLKHNFFLFTAANNYVTS